MTKPVLVFIFSNCMGGVASFNRNLINYTSLKDRCNTRVILLEAEEDKRARFTDVITADEVIHFPFSTLEKQYDVFERLYNIVGKETGCIIADDSVVLNMAGLFNLSKKVVYLVHDYFYVNAALHYQPVIDVVVAHASLFCDILLAATSDYQGKIYHIPYGVELVESLDKPLNPVLKLVFLGRLVEEKGVLLLKEIDAHLAEQGITVEWMIVGKGPLLDDLQRIWQNNSNVSFMQAADTAAVYSILEHQDILVFPSRFEGTPVSIMEGLSRGVVPVVADLPGGTRDMVSGDVGIRCPVKDARSYANAIAHLHHNRGILKEMQSACLRASETRFDIRKASNAYFTFFLKQSTEPLQVKNAIRVVQLSRLDNSILPGWLVYRFRKLKCYFFQRKP